MVSWSLSKKTPKKTQKTMSVIEVLDHLAAYKHMVYQNMKRNTVQI